MKIYAVITGDIVKSRKIEQNVRNNVIQSLKQAFVQINDTLLGGAGRFEIFRGDSFQGIVPMPEKALLIALIIRAHLRSYTPLKERLADIKTPKPLFNAYSDARIAIGLGSINEEQGLVAESQGEAFEKSGLLYERLKKDDERLGIITPWENINGEFETECLLADAVLDRWTPSTSRAVYHYLLETKNQQELANKFNISQPALHKRLVVIGNIKCINLFIGRYEEVISVCSK